MAYTKPQLNEIGNAESLVLGFNDYLCDELDPVTGEAIGRNAMEF